MKVQMINSVDQYAAGEEYDLPDEQADLFIVKGYAKGSLSREYRSDEVEALCANDQKVGV